MAGPYNYSINIPQPPAQNFLQSLMGIRQLQQMEDQSAIQQQQAAIQQQQAQFAQELQPLERQKLEAAIAAQRASTALTQLTLDQRKLVSSTLQNYLNDDTKTVKDIIPALPYLDTTAVENIGKAEQIRVNREVDTALKEGREITANDIRGWSNRQTLLKGPEQQQFQQSFLAMTPQFQSAAKTGMISAVNAAFAGNMGEARKAAAEVQQALINSKDSSPAAKAVSNSFGKIVDLIDQDPNLPKEVLALNVVNAAGLIGELKLAEETLKVYKEFGDLTKPGGAGKGKEVDMDMEELKRQEKKLQIQDLQQKVDIGRAQKMQNFASANKEGYKLKEQADSQELQAQKAQGILETIDSVQAQLPKNIGQSLLQDVKDVIPFWSNDISFLRTQYKSLIAPEAKKNLPPGAASDADMKLAREGVMNASANPKQLRKAVEIIVKESENQAKYTKAKLAWLSENNGSFGNAKKDLDVFGSIVRKGTSLDAWWSKIGKNLDPNAMPSEASPAAAGANLDALLNKYR